jgi:hypothetical protein
VVRKDFCFYNCVAQNGDVYWMHTFHERIFGSFKPFDSRCLGIKIVSRSVNEVDAEDRKTLTNDVVNIPFVILIGSDKAELTAKEIVQIKNKASREVYLLSI